MSVGGKLVVNMSGMVILLMEDAKMTYEINELAKEECWRMFRIIGELVEGFDKLSGIVCRESIIDFKVLVTGIQWYLPPEPVYNILGADLTYSFFDRPQCLLPEQLVNLWILLIEFHKGLRNTLTA